MGCSLHSVLEPTLEWVAGDSFPSSFAIQSVFVERRCFISMHSPSRGAVYEQNRRKVVRKRAGYRFYDVFRATQ